MSEQTPVNNTLETMPSGLEGQMLIAMPSIGDDRFDRAVIYICAHSPDGAMGLIVNKEAEELNFTDLLDQLNLLESSSGGTVHTPQLPVHLGGPVDTSRGFVLHSPDFFSDASTLQISETVAMTASLDVMRAIAQRGESQKALFALGYAGWSPGQLEAEMAHNGWLHCEADDNLLYGPSPNKYTDALAKIGIDLTALSGDVGHA